MIDAIIVVMGCILVGLVLGFSLSLFLPDHLQKKHYFLICSFIFLWPIMIIFYAVRFFLIVKRW